MVSYPPKYDVPKNNKVMAMAIMVALGVILRRLEPLRPLPSPSTKLGLANLMTLVALVFLGFKEALIVTFLRVVLGSILDGTFLGPIFFLSLVGGIAAILIMGMLYKAGKNHMSVIGISIF
jgi:heptaprenyl diphosphate synthase